MAGTYHSWLSRRSKIPHKWLKLVGHSFGLYIYTVYIYDVLCIYIYIDMMYCIHIYDVMYIVKAQNLGTMGYMYLFIYLLMYVFIFHVNQENWWLQVSSKHFFSSLKNRSSHIASFGMG